MVTTRLLIARHGNTFTPDQIPTRVGARTDLDLVASGRKQASNLARYLVSENLLPDVIFTSNLKRTYQMAEPIIELAGHPIPLSKESIFNEIDYGPDENKSEEEVVSRIGKPAIEKWDKDGTVPDGWKVEPDKIIQGWRDFARNIDTLNTGETILVITSNGIARFAPHLTGNFDIFLKENNIKISTGALCCLEKEESESDWTIKFWNRKPQDFV